MKTILTVTTLFFHVVFASKYHFFATEPAAVPAAIECSAEETTSCDTLSVPPAKRARKADLLTTIKDALNDKYSEFCGYPETRIPWSHLNVYGWPESVKSFSTHDWKKADCFAIGEALDKIRFERKPYNYYKHVEEPSDAYVNKSIKEILSRNNNLQVDFAALIEEGWPLALPEESECSTLDFQDILSRLDA